jgi:hypothetical protein
VTYYKTREEQIELERKKMIEREKERQRQEEYDKMLLENRLVYFLSRCLIVVLTETSGGRSGEERKEFSLAPVNESQKRI